MIDQRLCTYFGGHAALKALLASPRRVFETSSTVMNPGTEQILFESPLSCVCGLPPMVFESPGWLVQEHCSSSVLVECCKWLSPSHQLQMIKTRGEATPLPLLPVSPLMGFPLLERGLSLRNQKT